MAGVHAGLDISCPVPWKFSHYFKSCPPEEHRKGENQLVRSQLEDFIRSESSVELKELNCKSAQNCFVYRSRIPRAAWRGLKVDVDVCLNLFQQRQCKLKIMCYVVLSSAMLFLLLFMQSQQLEGNVWVRSHWQPSDTTWGDFDSRLFCSCAWICLQWATFQLYATQQEGCRTEDV